NDLKTYVRRFQELVILCPNMVPNNEKLMEVFIGGLPRSIEENVTASKPQTLEEAINIVTGDFSPLFNSQIIQTDVGKLKAKGDIGVFVGYSKESAVFRIHNKRTRKIHDWLLFTPF
nr:reverse transcriptase domain-containing protein [Tanacetum cinerariifolium]